MLLSGSEIIIECLKEQGVDTVFGIQAVPSSIFTTNFTSTRMRFTMFLLAMSRAQATLRMVMQDQLARWAYVLPHLALVQPTLLPVLQQHIWIQFQ